MSQRGPGMLGIRPRVVRGDDDLFEFLRRPKVPRISTSRSSTSIIIGEQNYEVTGGGEDAQSEEAEGEQDDHQSEPEVEEGQPSEEDEEYQEDDEDQEDNDDVDVSEEHSNRLNVGGREGCNSTSAIRKPSNTVITLTDSGLLDCPICFEPLTIPVYQCDQNGHIACSLCCTKIENKCPFCSCLIGSNRCRAIEKVVESSTTPCLNSKYGCNILVTYNEKNEHEKTCLCSPCSCPYIGCNFASSTKELYQHFGNAHLHSATSFLYDYYDGLSFSIILKKNDSFLIAGEVYSGTLFILNNRIEVLGNVVTVSCIQPSFMKDFYYDLLVTNKESSLKFRSVTKSTPSLQLMALVQQGFS